MTTTKTKTSKGKPRLTAKKDFKIYHPGADGKNYGRTIKKGDDLTDIPSKYLENLKTEGIL